MVCCYLCRKDERISYLGYYCEKCKKVQDLLSIYGDRVYEVLESVLCRTKDKQNDKVKFEINK